ncbi:MULTISPECIES: inorganic phosphate transporter [Leeuwenhoekiella]|uniref:Phosphate transporter n=1 Tax=Leeuwenhoekiella blandensis (strain CECT 7118 / CCUG 51940 / KCTC 22103 / MED217) TaxID=398720 RepID=A3XH70_LEEBM|nr:MULTISPECIES: inorganic phosphate transporter [Leeuwenhoekiella]EAQ51375.1 phosphate sodium symporter [Leeuwenhoekiella blandensis MED217]MAO45008.1 inorganic phosphate transporter [Leeuwenhoekiella sp.]MBQ52957.1 inorganic phosphate transporter [Leeuwenhoekiella sp.]MBQ53269.1 inorganic phosphate transporter [Leeuwenhoekiella sp.]HBT11086.1 inorganic phosphate transporter [Leeuwenhoekiella sp.]|tara:strand:- start:15414 stop:17660 length:2247 start_codon:yes stop_codon:yes gene_type:complete
MDNIYLIMLIALAILAIADLVVGVSNDAVNFLNSAIGSKAVSFKTIMIVASIGIAFGALSSSGMMEVARKGIFVPEKFYFDEIMIIFMAVMITDILLLDFFNTLGLPTSTTVSIVFELLGAAFCMTFIKLSGNSDTLLHLGEYINSDKAIEIIVGILLSVAIAFTVGALVQFVTRLLLTFNFAKRPTWNAAAFSGIATAAISYFIIIKGLKSADFVQGEFLDWANANVMSFIGLSFIAWFIISYILIKAFKLNVYIMVIVVGTFALAMAFAGNDLVNFIGVPMAAYNSYEIWLASGEPATTFTMESLAEKVPTQPFLLLAAGLVMILTLWFSKKARRVVKTSVDLSRQDEGQERFKANAGSRALVRSAMKVNAGLMSVLPDSAKKMIEKRFAKPKVTSRVATIDMPAFDLVRASVNLMIASVLISVATSLKLPLSTTYVTFMVAMGSSLADRAWGSESAVYRVAGVLNVIGGWFMTALSAFTAAAIMAFILYKGGSIALFLLFAAAVAILVRNYMNHKKRSEAEAEEGRLMRAVSNSIQGIINESTTNVASAFKRGSKVYAGTIEGLAKVDLGKLKKSKKGIAKLNTEVEELRNSLYYFIKNLDETHVQASRFYIDVLGYLQDVTQSIDFVTTSSYNHLNNNHKGLKFTQLKDLKEIEEKLEKLFSKIEDTFNAKNFDDLLSILEEKQNLLDSVSQKIEKQVERTRSADSSPKNTMLYFSILQETEDLIKATMNLLEHYYIEHKKHMQ